MGILVLLIRWKPLREVHHVFYIVFHTGEAVKLSMPEHGNPPPRGLEGLELDHVAIAVRSFDDALPLLETLTGVEGTPPERVESQGVEICFVGNVELIRPLVADNGVARFIERRGQGLHHIAYRTPDLAKLTGELEVAGYRFTSAGPMIGAGGHRIAFIHPKSAGGVLVELVEHH